MKGLVSLYLAIATLSAYSQESKEKLIDVSVAAGPHRASFSAGYFQNWQLGKAKRAGVGIGVRFTSFAGRDLYYITAPAKLTSGSTGPLVLFKENIVENIDSLRIKSPQVNALNLAINLDYRISKRIILGFNIDALGFSFGKKVNSQYINGAERVASSAKPTAFNILLISDNDRGSLNSELYGRYQVNEKFAFKIGGQFIFTEYTTRTSVQQLPEPNDRFRNKSLLLSVGLTAFL